MRAVYFSGTLGAASASALSMTFFGVQATTDAVTWIEASPEAPIHITNACLVAPAHKREARVLLQLYRTESDEPSDSAAQLLGVLSSADHGNENVSLELAVESKVGVRISGEGADGAVVHLIGTKHDLEESATPSEYLSGIGIFQDLEASSEEEGECGSSESEDEDDDGGGDDADDEGAKWEGAKSKRGKRRGRKGRRDDGTPADADESRPKKAEESERAVVPKQRKSVKHRSGVQYQDLLVGSGKRTTKGKFVAIHYTLRIGTKVVDKSGKNALKFRLGVREVIPGMDIGVAGMREGGERHIIVPPELGYGREGAPPKIPPNATLEFDVRLVCAW